MDLGEIWLRAPVRHSIGGIFVASHPNCHLQIGLLGPFYLRVEEEEIRDEVWKSKKALTMLKYLAARKGQKVSADMLIELLWPDNEDIDSTRNLHTAVWFARRVLTSKTDPEAESCLHYAHGSYWLELPEGCLDLHRFEEHVWKSRQLMKTDPAQALRHCEAALDLYRDDFLVEDVYDDWTISYREEYQELYFELILRSAKLLMEYRGDLQEAISILRSAVKKDEYREELYQMGIKFYILADRHVEAINLYKRYSKMLMDEFQLQPSHATQELIRQLHDHRERQEQVFSIDLALEPTTGAYICDKETLTVILTAEKRRMSRGGNAFSTLLVASKKQGAKGSRQMNAAFHILQRSLRSSDLISQYSDDQIVIFLPDTEATEAKALHRRLRQILEKKSVDISTLSFTLLDSEQLEEMQNTLVTTPAR